MPRPEQCLRPRSQRACPWPGPATARTGRGPRHTATALADADARPADQLPVDPKVGAPCSAHPWRPRDRDRRRNGGSTRTPRPYVGSLRAGPEPDHLDLSTLRRQRAEAEGREQPAGAGRLLRRAPATVADPGRGDNAVRGRAEHELTSGRREGLDACRRKIPSDHPVLAGQRVLRRRNSDDLITGRDLNLASQKAKPARPSDAAQLHIDPGRARIPDPDGEGAARRMWFRRTRASTLRIERAMGAVGPHEGPLVIGPCTGTTRRPDPSMFG